MPRQSSQKFKLTKSAVEQATPRERRYRITDTEQPGFYLMVYPTGRKAFGVRYVTADGKNSEANLGEYPSVLPAAARDEAARMRSAVKLAKADPAQERRAEREEGARARAQTVAALVEAYLKNEARTGEKSQSTMAKVRHYLGNTVTGLIGRHKVSDVDHEVIQETLWTVREQSAKRRGGDGIAAANDARKYMRQLFEFARIRGWRADNPVQYVKPFKAASRERMATRDELRRLWEKWEADKASEDVRGASGALALQFLTLTLQRGEEVVSMTWYEVDLQERRWKFEAERKKERRSAVVPLSDEAVAVLEQARELHPQGIGPFIGRDGRSTLKRNSLTQAFRRDCAELGIDDLTPHDLRRTGRTILTDPEALAFPPHVGELVLNHSAGDKLLRTYDVNSYITEKRRALDAWGRLVGEIAAGEARAGGATSKVLSFPA